MDSFNAQRAISAAYAEGKRDGAQQEREKQEKRQDARDIATYERFVAQIEAHYGDKIKTDGIEEEAGPGLYLQYGIS